MLNTVKEAKDPPLFSLEIGVGPSKKGTLVIRQGDNIGKVVKNFAKTFQLSKEKIEKLKTLIEECARSQLTPFIPFDSP